MYGDDIASVLITEEQIQAKVEELAELIAKRYSGDAARSDGSDTSAGPEGDL